MVLWGAVVGLMSWYTIDGPSTMNDGKCAGEYPLHCLQKYMLKQKRTDWNRKCHLMRTLHICWSKLPQKSVKTRKKEPPFLCGCLFGTGLASTWSRQEKKYGTLNNKNGVWKDIAQRKSIEALAYLIEILSYSVIWGREISECLRNMISAIDFQGFPTQKILAHSCAFLREKLAFLRKKLAFLRILARKIFGITGWFDDFDHY